MSVAQVKRIAISDSPWPWLLPLIALLMVFTIYPLIYNVWLSFHEFVPRKRTLAFVGFDNWIQLWNDTRFPGIAWASERLKQMLLTPKPVAFVTKGLDRKHGRIVTYAQTVPGLVGNIAAFIGIGGPCIARELANRYPTTSVYACRDRQAGEFAAGLLRTPYYRLAVSDDVIGVEACAALKNFFAIGVSAMQTRYPDTTRPDGQSKNPTAAAFTQAASEMAVLCERIGGGCDTAFDLAGIGDLHVTVGGGRNSRLGHGLGRNQTVSSMMAGDLAGETVEGIDTARMLVELLNTVPSAKTDFPLACAIIVAVLDGGALDFDFATLFA